MRQKFWVCSVHTISWYSLIWTPLDLILLQWAIWESSKILSNKHLLKWILTLDLEIYKRILFFQYMDNMERIPCSWKLWYLKVSRCLSKFWVGSEPMAEWPYFKSLSCLHFFRYYNFSQLPPRKYLIYSLKFVRFSITLDVNFPFKKKSWRNK